MRISKIILLILPILFVSAAIAEETKQLTIEDCIKLGLDNNYTIKVSRSKVDQAEAKFSETNAAMLPSLKFTGGYTRLSEVTFNQLYAQFMGKPILDNYRIGISAQQPIFTGHRLSSTADMTEQLAKASKEDLNKDKSQLILDIQNAYWSLYKAIDFRKQIEDNIKQIEAHLQDIDNFAKVGMATNNDVLKVKVQLSNAKLLMLDADNAVQMNSMALCNSIGLPLETNIVPSSKINTNSENPPNLMDLKNTALNNRPEIKAMQIRIKSGESAVSLAKAGWYPQIFAAANFTYNNPNQRYIPQLAQFKGTWDMGLNLTYDIWNWNTTSHQTAQAEAQLEQSKFGLAQIKDAIILDVSQSYLGLVKAKEKIDFCGFAVTQAEENYRVTNERFKSGMAINSDLLDAETSLLQAKINYTAAKVDFELAMAKLDRAIGK